MHSFALRRLCIGRCQRYRRAPELSYDGKAASIVTTALEPDAVAHYQNMVGREGHGNAVREGETPCETIDGWISSCNSCAVLGWL